MPKVSVIVPCHNSIIYLETCLNSLINQTLKDIEIICINDHSTDKTPIILKKFEKQFPNLIKYLETDEFHGVSAARNKGLDFANGDFIGFVDSDDVISLNMYEKFYHAAKYFQVSLVNGNFDIINSRQFKHSETFTNPDTKSKYIDLEEIPSYLYVTSPACWDKLFSHSLIGKKRFIPCQIGEDYAFSNPLLLKSKTIVSMTQKDYYYRRNKFGTMAKLSQPNNNIFDALLVAIEILKSTKEYLVYHQNERQIMEVIHRHLLENFCRAYDWKINNNVKKEILRKLFLYTDGLFPYFEEIHINCYCSNIVKVKSLIKQYRKDNITTDNIEQEKKDCSSFIRALQKK